MNKQELKKISASIKPEFNLGKNGITETFVDTVSKYLDAHSIVKIKSSLAEDKDALKYYAEEVSKLSESEIVDIRGFTFTLYKEEE